MENVINHNADFLFLYDATQCNPNGDPDQENKPRMDYATKTNLVTDTRVKRYMRDYLKSINDQEVIFVDMEGERQVSMEQKMEAIIKRAFKKESLLTEVFADDATTKDKYLELIKKAKDADELWKSVKNKKLKDSNVAILEYLIKQQYIDIRMFGSAFAVEGFSRAYTGPIQLNWGYSLNEVELMESSSIVTSMNDDSSNFGRDYRVHYSLLAFNGTINKYAAKTTGLTDADLTVFREAIWQSIPALPTRSKLNQYPKLYVELVYNDGYSNGQFGDLRNYVSVTPKEGKTAKQVRGFADLNLDVSLLEDLLVSQQEVIKEVIIKAASGIEIKTA